MRRPLALLAVPATLALLLTGCGGGASGPSATEAVQNYLQAVEELNAETAFSYTDTPYEQAAGTLTADTYEALLDSAEPISDYTVAYTQVAESGNTAQVSGTYKLNDEENDFTFNLSNNDDDWKIDNALTASTLPNASYVTYRIGDSQIPVDTDLSLIPAVYDITVDSEGVYNEASFKFPVTFKEGGLLAETDYPELTVSESTKEAVNKLIDDQKTKCSQAYGEITECYLIDFDDLSGNVQGLVVYTPVDDPTVDYTVYFRYGITAAFFGGSYLFRISNADPAEERTYDDTYLVNIDENSQVVALQNITDW